MKILFIFACVVLLISSNHGSEIEGELESFEDLVMSRSAQQISKCMDLNKILLCSSKKLFSQSRVLSCLKRTTRDVVDVLMHLSKDKKAHLLCKSANSAAFSNFVGCALG